MDREDPNGSSVLHANPLVGQVITPVFSHSLKDGSRDSGGSTKASGEGPSHAGVLKGKDLNMNLTRLDLHTRTK